MTQQLHHSKTDDTMVDVVGIVLSQRSIIQTEYSLYNDAGWRDDSTDESRIAHTTFGF